MSPDLVQAYRAAEYRVLTPGLSLRIDRRSEGLAEMMALFGESSAAIVTADNPHGRHISDEQNRRARTRLRLVLYHLGFSKHNVENRDPEGRWPTEKGYLVLGIDRSRACDLGREFEQNAIVVIESDATPRLEILNATTPGREREE